MDAEDIRGVFEPIGPIQLKRLFSGHGVYRHGRIIAISTDGMIWLKADAISRSAFEQAGSRPFTYDRKGKATALTYWSMPETAYDDADVLARYVHLAEAAADRAIAGTLRRKKRKAPRSMSGR